ncbi:MAG: hypothetical protein QM699_07365 [Amaricoccus sp.]|uniref:hypothetical protein n=1 Tax=Amaricoccus sp. TaxID=1872485 RepID=UPI0039E59F6B
MTVVAFLPFIAFALLTGPLGASGALLVAAVLSAVLVLRGWRRGETPKILEVGTLALFLGIAGFIHLTARAESIAGVKLAVDIGLLGIVLVSLLVGRPFTLQYAREQAPREVWDDPRFVQLNRRITLAWAIAFAIVVLADALLDFATGIPKAVGILATVAAIAGAAAYTVRSAKAARARAGRPVAGAGASE